MKRSKEERVFTALSHIVLIAMCVCVLVPLALLIISSFTDNNTLIQNDYSFFPSKLSLENYTYVFESNNKVMNAYLVSIGLTVVGTVFGTALTVQTGYVISRPGLHGRRVMAFLVFFTLLFNGGLVPTYINYTQTFGIKNTFAALLIPTLLMNGFYVMLVKSYFTANVPEEILEAASIDGAGEFRKYFSIAIPMARPIIATVALFIAIAYWNDWNNGYIYISTRTELYSIQNLLHRMQQNIDFLVQNSSAVSNVRTGNANIPSEGIRMSIAVLGVLPILICYPFIQNNFIKGITLGGVKG